MSDARIVLAYPLAPLRAPSAPKVTRDGVSSLPRGNRYVEGTAPLVRLPAPEVLSPGGFLGVAPVTPAKGAPAKKEPAVKVRQGERKPAQLSAEALRAKAAAALRRGDELSAAAYAYRATLATS